MTTKCASQENSLTAIFGSLFVSPSRGKISASCSGQPQILPAWPYWALSQPPSAGITAVPCCTWLLFASTQPLSGLKAQAEGRTSFTNCGAGHGIKLEGGCCPYHSGITAAYHQSLAHLAAPDTLPPSVGSF